MYNRVEATVLEATQSSQEAEAGNNGEWTGTSGSCDQTSNWKFLNTVSVLPNARTCQKNTTASTCTLQCSGNILIRLTVSMDPWKHVNQARIISAGTGAGWGKKGGADGHKVTGVISAERRRRRGAEGSNYQSAITPPLCFIKKMYNTHQLCKCSEALLQQSELY